MANELKFYSETSGQTITAKIIDDAGAQVGSDVACPEVGTDARYIGDMPTAVAGTYGVVFYSGTDIVGAGEINWDGTQEVTNLTIKSDTSDLFANQGNWLTATGFSTHSAADVWAVVSRTLTDKTGFELSATERDAIATEVEAHLIDEADGQTIINAIVGAIGNSNVDQVALVAAIRADLERASGALDSIETKAQADARQVALLAQHAQTQDDIGNISGGYDDTALIEKVDTIDSNVDSIKAKTDTLVNTDLSTLESSVSAIPTNTLLSTDARLNYLDANISTRLATASYTAPNNAGITLILEDTNELQQNQDDWATATGFATPVNVTDATATITAAIDNKPVTPVTDIGSLATSTEVQALNLITTTDIRTELTAELTEISKMYTLKGLDPDNPVTFTPTSITANGISITISGDGETTSTLTSNA